MRFLFLLLLLPAIVSYSQPMGFYNNASFLNYLLVNKNYTDALLLIKKTEQASDTFNFLSGKLFYINNKFDTAKAYFRKINRSNYLYCDAKIYENACLLKYEPSILMQADTSVVCNDTSNAMQTLIEGGKSLIVKDFVTYQMLQPAFQYSILKDEYLKFNSILNEIRKRKQKSPAVAGIYSAIIPGLGKVYAGKPWQGFSAFIAVSLLGLNAYDGYHHKQFHSPQFYIFGSLFALFYGGNIYGSIVTVKSEDRQFNDKIKQQVFVTVDMALEKLMH